MSIADLQALGALARVEAKRYPIHREASVALRKEQGRRFIGIVGCGNRRARQGADSVQRGSSREENGFAHGANSRRNAKPLFMAGYLA